MAVFKFKCTGCGSTQCEKEDNGYRCIYCGNVQDVIFPEEKKTEPEQHVEFQEPVEAHYHSEPSGRTKFLIIKLLVCLFAGYLGVHKFMEGRIISGLLYVFTGGLFGIGVFIDVIRYIIELAHSGRTYGN